MLSAKVKPDQITAGAEVFGISEGVGAADENEQAGASNRAAKPVSVRCFSVRPMSAGGFLPATDLRSTWYGDLPLHC